jgi:hypothetical protein
MAMSASPFAHRSRSRVSRSIGCDQWHIVVDWNETSFPRGADGHSRRRTGRGQAASERGPPTIDSDSEAEEPERQPRESALDETIEQSFPASDPPSTDPNPDSYTATTTSRRREQSMDVQHYNQRLLDLEKALSERIGRAVAEGRGTFIDSAHDVGDSSVADEVASERAAMGEFRIQLSLV